MRGVIGTSARARTMTARATFGLQRRARVHRGSAIFYPQHVSDEAQRLWRLMSRPTSTACQPRRLTHGIPLMARTCGEQAG
jgi:hypothetical protein